MIEIYRANVKDKLGVDNREHRKHGKAAICRPSGLNVDPTQP